MIQAIVKEPDVTVVIPVHDRPEALNRALMSVLAQESPASIEILVIDDASTVPVSVERQGVRVVRHPVNRGAAGARNTGMREARGEFIAFLDSDDIWEPGKLANQLAYLRAAPHDVVGVFTLYAFESNPTTRIGPPSNVLDWFAYFLLGCRVGPGSTLMFRRRFIALIGEQDTRLPRFEDWDWLLRASRVGRFAVIAGPGALLTLSGRPTFDTVAACAEHIEEKWRSQLTPSQLRRLRAALNVERAAASAWNGRRWDTVLYLLRAAASDPQLVVRELGNRVKRQR